MLVVDEAAMVSTHNLEQILKVVEAELSVGVIGRRQAAEVG